MASCCFRPPIYIIAAPWSVYTEHLAVRHNNTHAAYQQHDQMFWVRCSESIQLNCFERCEPELAAPLLLAPKEQCNALSKGATGIKMDGC